MKFEDVKILWPILGAVVVLSGFYYTTQLRLDQLETDVTVLQHRAMTIESRAKKLEQGNRKFRKKDAGRKQNKTKQ